MMSIDKLIMLVEVHGASTLLPTNLSDKWLFHLGKSADVYLLAEEEKNEGLVDLIELILILLVATTHEDNVTIDTKQMEMYLGHYCLEIILEKLFRKQALPYTAADLSNILTRDEVEINLRLF